MYNKRYHVHHICLYIQEGVSPLFIASQNGYQAVVELLLIHGAKTDVHRNVCK